MAAFYRKLLKDDEELVRVIRQYPVVHIWRLFWGYLFLFSAFFFSVPLFRLKTFGLAVFTILLIIAIILIAKSIVIYYFNSFIITDKRIIDWDQRGLFHREISETDYSKVQDITYKIKGFWPTILNFGILQIQTAGGSVLLELSYVKNPSKIQSLLIDIKRNYDQSAK